MRELFACQIGLSDHTMGMGAALASIALGAVMIEKHFTLARADGGVDSVFSMEPEEMKNLIVESERAWQALGQVHYGTTEKESASLKFRRSLYIARDMKAGETLTRENLRLIRPGYGLAPRYYDLVLGKKVKTDVKKGTPLSWEILI
jgi:sialic acid synthase SpsE